jgi:hypothetical protein
MRLLGQSRGGMATTDDVGELPNIRSTFSFSRASHILQGRQVRVYS